MKKSSFDRDVEKCSWLTEVRPDLVEKIRAGRLSISGAYGLARRGVGAKEYIYFIQSEHGGPIKVGCSFEPKRRLKQLQMCCPFKLVFLGMLVGGKSDEKDLHLKMQKFHVWGEWFHPNTYLAGFIRYASDPSFMREEDLALDAAEAAATS